MVSSRIAATDAGPSAWITRSRWCSARSHSCSGVFAQNSERYRYGPKWCTCARAYSLGTRRQSPVATTAAPVLPWYERYATRPCRVRCAGAPSGWRSIASAPLFVKNTRRTRRGRAEHPLGRAAAHQVRRAGATVVRVAAAPGSPRPRGALVADVGLTAGGEVQVPAVAWSHTCQPGPPRDDEWAQVAARTRSGRRGRGPASARWRRRRCRCRRPSWSVRAQAPPMLAREVIVVGLEARPLSARSPRRTRRRPVLRSTKPISTTVRVGVLVGPAVMTVAPGRSSLRAMSTVSFTSVLV